jgi:hypothetical protein
LIDSLSNDDVNEIADAPAGITKEAVRVDLKKSQAAEKQAPELQNLKPPTEKATTVKYATIGPNRSVSIH